MRDPYRPSITRRSPFQGNVYFWAGAKPKDGYQFAADNAACQSLLIVLPTLVERPLKLLLGQVTRRLFGGEVPQVKNYPLRQFAHLELRADSQAPHTLVIEPEGPWVRLTLHPSLLAEFAEGLEDIQEGGGDWALWGDCDKQHFWFWPTAQQMQEAAAKRRRR